jgi:hypothetical protein
MCRQQNGRWCTIDVCWHVDDLKANHMKPQVVDDFIDWVKRQYGTIGEVKVTRGKFHTYLGMIWAYSEPGQVIVDMTVCRGDDQGIPK